jgi:hypothetical protein
MREKFSSEHITLASQTVRTLKEWAAKNKPQIEEAASEKETGS